MAPISQIYSVQTPATHIRIIGYKMKLLLNQGTFFQFSCRICRSTKRRSIVQNSVQTYIRESLILIITIKNKSEKLFQSNRNNQFWKIIFWNYQKADQFWTFQDEIFKASHNALGGLRWRSFEGTTFFERFGRNHAPIDFWDTRKVIFLHVNHKAFFEKNLDNYCWWFLSLH